ncbi:MAG: Gfo/Idh/MocA family oxidoreductase [Pyrinomonadaceae bacterium]
MKDVDAVIVATADFQHAMHGVEAVKAGRDAYVEKPMANTMADARAIRKRRRGNEENRSDRHAAPQHTELLCAPTSFIRSGKFGDIVMVGDDLER